MKSAMRNIPRVAAVAAALFPVFWVLDMPSMLLAMGMRFPRWLFWWLVVRALSGH